MPPSSDWIKRDWDIKDNRVIETRSSTASFTRFESGETAIYTTAVVKNDSGEVKDVEPESGREFRHYREQLKRKRKRRSRANDLRGVRECQGYMPT